MRYLFGPGDPTAVVEAIADPSVRIMSLIVTEGGYNLTPDTCRMRISRPGVVGGRRRREDANHSPRVTTLR